MVLIAIIIAAGLTSVVTRLEQKRWPRWIAAFVAVMVLLA